MPKLKRIKKAKISHISLCPKGKNRFRTLFKAKDSSFRSIEDRLRSLISTKLGADYVYIADVFSDSVIYEVGDRLYRIGYSGDGEELVGDSVMVTREMQYFELPLMTKAMTEEGVVYGIAYAPNIADYDGDFATPETVKEMMYSFAKEGEGIDICHSFEALKKEDAFVVESFLIQENDPRFSGIQDSEGNPVDVTGGWAIAVKLENEELLEKYRSGEWEGFSIGGQYITEPVDDDEVDPSLIRKCIKAIQSLVTRETPEPNQEASEMSLDYKELGKAVADALEPKFKEIEGKLSQQTQPPAALKKEEPEGGKGTVETPTIDLTDKAAVEARIKQLQQDELRKSVDVNDIKSLQALLKAIDKNAETKEDDSTLSVRDLTKANNEDAVIDELAGLLGSDYGKEN